MLAPTLGAFEDLAHQSVNQAVMLWHRWGATPEQIFEFYYGMPVTR